MLLVFCICITYNILTDRRQCQLYCKATYYGFYRKFADKVEDGTECEDSTGEGICVDGQCKVNGCSVNTIWF